MKNGVLDDGLAVAIIDALTSQICVVDAQSNIIVVNRAWEQNATKYSGRNESHIGVNYLSVCEGSVGLASDKIIPFVEGLRAVLGGGKEFFQCEYPCHAPNEFKWYIAKVSRLRLRHSDSEIIGAVIAHVDITDRKLAELESERLADIDTLTGIAGRRFFGASAQIEIDRCSRCGVPTSVLMVDLDNFKSINDTYGHAMGDQVLRRVAALGVRIFRDCDLFARWGGEEFTGLLRGTDEWGAIMAGEKLRAAIEQLSILDATGQPLVITASIGVSSVGRSEGTVEDALVRADHAMYRAKAAGKNCVRTAEYPRKVRA